MPLAAPRWPLIHANLGAAHRVDVGIDIRAGARLRLLAKWRLAKLDLAHLERETSGVNVEPNS